MTSGGKDLLIKSRKQKAEGRRQKAERDHDARAARRFSLLPSAFCLLPSYVYSTNVTLLISLSVVCPSITLRRADSRRNVIPSSFAAFLISDAGLRSRIMPRIRSERSRSSEIAARPWKPVPLHSRQPAPSKNVVLRYCAGSSPDSTRNASPYLTSCLHSGQILPTRRWASTQLSADTKLYR